MVSVSPGLFFIILVQSSVRNLSGIKVCRFCLSICLLSASLDRCIFSGYVQHIESVAITHSVITIEQGVRLILTHGPQAEPHLVLSGPDL